jgi:hypothetical protein
LSLAIALSPIAGRPTFIPLRAAQKRHTQGPKEQLPSMSDGEPSGRPERSGAGNQLIDRKAEEVANLERKTAS